MVLGWNLKDRKRGTTFLVILVLLSTCAANLLLDRHSSYRVSAVEAATSLGVYWDSSCSVPVTSIDWGNLVPGEAKKIPMYVRNEGNVSCVLSLQVTDWQADNNSNCVTFGCEQPKINPGQAVQINPTLQVLPTAPAVSSFGFNIVMVALAGLALALVDLGGLVLNAGANQSFFVYADPNRMTRAVATYDVASGSLIYGLCANEQNQGFDTAPNWVSQGASDKGRLLLSSKTVLMFGGWAPHWCVNYLQTNGLTPVSSYVQSVSGVTHYRFVDTKTSAMLVDVHDINFTREDYFVLMVFKDGSNNSIFVSYGFDWKGTWSAGIYLKSISSNLAYFTNQYYVFHWIDSSADGIPQPEEMTQVAAG